MAHKIHIDQKSGEHMFASNEANPVWHSLGQRIKGLMTSEEAIKLAYLDWEVLKVPMFFYSTTQDLPELLESTKTFATVRADTSEQLGAVKAKYKILQNTELFGIVDDLIGGLEAVFETAGALNGGETIFITAKLPEYIRVDEEVIDQYLVMTNNHCGDYAVRIMFTPICVVCNNTLQMAIKSSKKFITLKHTENLQQRLLDVDKSLGIINQLQVDLQSCVETLTNIDIVEKQAINYFSDIHSKFQSLQGRNLKFLDRINDFYYDGPGQQQECRKGTAWGAYQAVTGFICNEKVFRGDTSKMKSLLTGESYNIMLKAKELAYELQ